MQSSSLPRRPCHGRRSPMSSQGSTACTIRRSRRCQYDRPRPQNCETHRWRRDMRARNRAERDHKRSGRTAWPLFAADASHPTRSRGRTCLKRRLKSRYLQGVQFIWRLQDQRYCFRVQNNKILSLEPEEEEADEFLHRDRCGYRPVTNRRNGLSCRM